MSKTSLNKNNPYDNSFVDSGVAVKTSELKDNPYSGNAVLYNPTKYLPFAVERAVGQAFTQHGGVKNIDKKYLKDIEDLYNIPLSRHEAQPWYASLGNALNQAILGQIVGGTLEGTGYLLDLPQYIDLAKGTEKDFGNWFSDIGKALRTWTEEVTPVYTDPNKQGGFNPEDWTWWMSNLPSVASTLSLMIPAAGAVKGLSMFGKMTKLSKGLGLINDAGKLTKTGMRVTGVTQAFMSRHMEGLMEASGTAEELKQLAGTKLDEKQYKTFQKNYGIELTPENVGGKLYYTLDENSATEIAAKAASNIYKADWAMIIQDIPQYLLLNTPFGKATEKLTAGVAKKLGQSAAPVIAKAGAVLLADAAGEGGEEAYQFAVSERSKELALADAGLMDRRDLSTALKSYTKSGDFWTAAFFGAIGAGVMQTAGKPLNRMINRVKGIESENERRMKDMDAWKSRIDFFNKSMLVAESLGSPEAFEAIKQDATTNMAIKAAENGNLDYMIQTIDAIADSNEADQQILGITKEAAAVAKANNPTLLSDLKKVGEVYQKNLNRHGKEFAGLITKEEINLNKLDKKIGQLQNNVSGLYTNVPNISKLSNSGQTILRTKVEIQSNKEIKKQLEKYLLEAKDNDHKKQLTSRIKRIDGVINTLENETIESIEETYSKEDRVADKGIATKSKELTEYNKAALSLEINKELRERSKTNLDEYRTEEWQKKATIKRKKIEADAIKTAAASAITAEEMQNVADATRDTEHEKTTNTIISDKAVVENNNAEETAKFMKMQAENSESAAEVSAQNEQEYREAITTSVNESPLAKRYYDDNGNMLVALYFKDREAIKEAILALSETTEDAQEEMILMNFAGQFGRLVKTNDPSTLIRFVEKAIIQAKLYNNTAAAKVINAIGKYYASTTTSAAAVRNDVKNSAKEARIEAVTTDGRTPSDSKKGRGVKWIKTSKANNAIVLTKYRSIKTGEYVNTLDKNEFDEGFLLDLGIPVGGTIHIEINEFDQGYNPNDPRRLVTAENRRYRIVYYIDGNINNLNKNNRKVVGVLPLASPTITNEEGVVDIERLRNELFRAFPPELTKSNEQKQRIVNTGFTTTVAGLLTEYSKEEKYISINDAVDPVVDRLIKSGKLTKEEARDIKEKGGFYLGYINEKGEAIFPHSMLPDRPMPNVMPGEMIVAIPNPSLPGDMLILRAFKQPLRTLAKTMQAFTQERIKEALDIITKDLAAQDAVNKSPVTGLSAAGMNKLQEELAFPTNARKFLLQQVKTLDIVDVESAGYKTLLGFINDAWLNFNKRYLNSLDYTTTFGDEVKTGPFNRLMSDYVKMNITPGKPFNNVQVLMNTDFNAPGNVAKVAAERKEVAKVVTTKKEVLQPEVVKEAKLDTSAPKQVDIPKQPKDVSKQARKTPVKGSFDTGMVSSADAIEKDLTPKKSDEESKEGDEKIFRLKVAEKNRLSQPKSTQEGLAWIKSKLPHVAINDIEEIRGILNEAVKGGYEALGAMYNAAIYVNNEPFSGVLFHEAFHVLFNYGLSEKDVIALTKDIPGDTMLEKEEYLANQFAIYMIADQADSTILGRIRKFFRQLKTLIRAFAGANVTSVIELADRADLGFYKKSIRTSKFNDTTLRTKVENWSFEKAKEAVDSISNHIIMEVIPKQRASNPELSIKSDVEILQAFTTKDNPYKIFQQVYNDIYEIYEKLDAVDTNDPRLDLLADLLNNFFNADLTPGVLVAEVISALAYNNGIKITIDKIEDVVSEQEQENESVGFTPEEHRENWQVTFSQTSAKENAPTRVKNFIRYIKTGETNSFGLPKYVEYDDTYDTILKDLEGSRTVEDIVSTLKESLLFKPEYQQILDMMEKDRQFATDMLQAFSRDLTAYTIVINKNGQYIVTDSNRKGLVNSIVNEWTNSVLRGELVTVDAAGNTTIDTIKARELKDQFESLYSTIKNTKEGEEVDPSIYKQLSEITNKFGFEIDPKVFNYIQTLKIKNRNNFYTGQYSLNTILNRFVQGINPFDVDTLEVGGDIKSEISSIRSVANVVKRARPELFESSFFDIDGNRVYAHDVPTFLSSFANRVTNVKEVQSYIDEMMKDDFFFSTNGPSNYILKKLNNAKSSQEELDQVLNISFVDGLTEIGNRVSYPEMTYADLQTFTIASYFNNANKTYSVFRLPVFSDAGRMGLVRVERPKNNKEAVSELLSLAEKEFNRISLLQEKGGLGVTNYDSDINKSTKTGYHFMSMLNGKIDGSPTLNKKDSLAVIEKHFDELAEQYYNNLINNKVLTLKKDKFDVENSRIDKRILANKSVEQFREYIKEILINDYLVRSSMSLLTVGDPAFYTNKEGSVTIDYITRAKEIMSPKLIPDITAEYTEVDSKGKVVKVIKVSSMYRSIYLDDAIINAPSGVIIAEQLDRLVEQGVITPAKAKQIKVAYSVENPTINQTDGQAYTTLPFYRESMISFGRWTPKHQAAYKRLVKAQGTANDIALMLQPIKPFVFTQIYNSDLKRFIPVQHKNSEYLLLPQLVKSNPKLAKLYKYMVKNNVGVANFNSAVKVGGFGSINLDDLSDVVQPVIQEIPTIDRGIQQETPEHLLDTENLFGTQLRKLIMSDLNEGTTYFGGRTSEELYQLYEDLIIQDLKEAYNNIEAKFLDESGELNYEKLHELLLDEGRKRSKGSEFEKAIALKIDRNGLNRTVLPLFHPLFSNTTESLLTSIFRNGVTKQKSTGAAVVQVSNFGLSRELKLVFDTDENRQAFEESTQLTLKVNGLQYAETVLPAWSKEFFKDFVDEEGNVDFDMAERGLPAEVFEMIGYRIPTEGKYSMLPLRVVGFLPLESGGSVMLPAEITKISGSDFDIDKMYLMMKAFKRDTFGNYEVVKYDESKGVGENSKAARDNMKFDLMMSVLQNPYTLSDILTPGDYEYNRSVATAILNKTGKKSSLTGLFDIITQDEMAIRNMTGKKLVGIAAIQNAHHALRQHYNLVLNSDVKFDGEVFTKLGEKEAKTQFVVVGGKVHEIVKDSIDRNISRNLSEFLAMVVDNAKDPLAAFMNYNTYTADIISLLVGLGVDTHTAIFFMNQPIVLEVVKNKFENPNKNIKAIIRQLAKKYTVDLKQETPNLNTETLYKALGSTEIDQLQKDVLVALSKYQKLAKDLGDVIRASSADTRGLGASISHGEVITKTIDKILTSEFFGISGVEELFTNTGKHSFVKGFTEYGIEKPIENILSKLYPYNNTVFTIIKDAINDQIVYRNLTPEERNFINRTLVSYLISKFGFFNIVDRAGIINSVPNKLIELKSKFPVETNNPLLKRLTLENKNDRVPIDMVTFNNGSKLSEGQRVRIQETWSDMLNPAKNTNVELREFAEDLIKYSYYTTGLNFTPNSFSHLIPVDAYISLVKDDKGFTLSDVLYQELDVYSKLSAESINIEELVETFLDQFYRNNYTNPTYVPRLNEDRSNYTTKSESRIVVDVNEVTDDSLYVEDVLNKDYVGKRFIAEKTDSEYKLYKFAGFDQNSGKLIFDKVTPLGIPNYIQEYNRNSSLFLESAIESNRNTITKTQINLTNKRADLETLDKSIPNFIKVEDIPTKEQMEEFKKMCPNVNDIKAGRI